MCIFKKKKSTKGDGNCNLGQNHCKAGWKLKITVTEFWKKNLLIIKECETVG